MKRAEKIKFSLVFVCSRFTEISYFLSFPSNENVRKQHLSANAYFCVNMKFSYRIAGRKDEIFCRIVTKTSDFLLVFRSTFRWRYSSKEMNISVILQRKQAIGQLFVEEVYIFSIISFRKGDRRIADLFFFSTLWIWRLYITWSRYYSSAYSGSFYWPCGIRNTILMTGISLWDWDQTGNKTC